MPDSVISTSMRGRPSSASGISAAPQSPPEAVEAGFGAEQRQGLGDRGRLRS